MLAEQDAVARTILPSERIIFKTYDRNSKQEPDTVKIQRNTVKKVDANTRKKPRSKRLPSERHDRNGHEGPKVGAGAMPSKEDAITKTMNLEEIQK